MFICYGKIVHRQHMGDFKEKSSILAGQQCSCNYLSNCSPPADPQCYHGVVLVVASLLGWVLDFCIRIVVCRSSGLSEE